jgi:hypothetical protein
MAFVQFSHCETQLQRVLHSLQTKGERGSPGGQYQTGHIVYFTLARTVTNFNFQTLAHSAVIDHSCPIAQSRTNVVHDNVRCPFLQYEAVLGHA